MTSSSVAPVSPPISDLESGGIKIETAKLSVPSNEYDADYAWVTVRNGAISLFFAKGDAGREGLVSRIEVRYAPEAFVGHFWENSRDFHEKVRAQLAGTDLARRYTREHKKPEALSPIKQHSVWANLDIISRHLTAATLDFYHLPAAEIVRYTRTRDRSRLDVSPVLRVNTTIFEVLHLLDASEPLAKEYASLLKGILGEEEDKDAER